MEKENIFNEIFKNLSGEDKVRLLNILRQHPEYFEHLLKNYKRKKEALFSGNKKAVRQIIEEEKGKLIELINKNIEPENNA